MRDLYRGRRRRLTISVVVLFLMAGGIAYATIPGSGNVYSACMLKNVGTIRLIDPSLPSSSLMSHCTAFEAPIGWNQQGQTGAAGAPGKDGAGPTVTQLPAGDSHCSAGGAAITDASGSTAYVCSGRNGADGAPFSGTFTSPNHLFSLTVADGGVEIKGPDSTITLPSSGGVTVVSAGTVSLKGGTLRTVANDENVTVNVDRAVTVGRDEMSSVGRNRTTVVNGAEQITVHGSRDATVESNDSVSVGANRTAAVGGSESVTVGASRTETVGGSESVTVGASRTVSVGGNEGVTVGGNRNENVAGGLDLRVGGALNLRGSLVTINDGGTSCKPVARVDDLISASLGVILTGSATVCIGS